MAYKKLAVLAHRLHQRTLEGKVDWELTANTDVYQASFASYAIRISTQPSRESPGAVDVEISVVDDEGLVVESFLDVDLPREMFEEVAGTERHPYQDMKETYDTARRLALGSEKAINEILLDLDDD